MKSKGRVCDKDGSQQAPETGGKGPQWTEQKKTSLDRPLHSWTGGRGLAV